MATDTSPGQTFPKREQFHGFMKPCRFEGEVRDLEVEGTIPDCIDGTFFRVMPDPQFVPFFDADPWFNGDGSVSAFRIQNGHVNFKQRYVQTEKFVREREAKRSLFGKYRNKYTDAVTFKVRSTANTNVFYFKGKLLACKEDSPPYALDPTTLETIGLYDFDGQLPSMTFTAHPKIGPVSRELVGFGYEAKGDGTPDVCYYSVSPDGKFTETVWLVAPVVAMIHDFAVTENWVVFPMIPQTCDIERMKQGGEHWQWDPNLSVYVGVLPRRGAKGSDVKWFRSPNAFPGHVYNAYEEDGKILLDISVSDKNVFFWWPDAQGNAPDPREIAAFLFRFTIDPNATTADPDLPPAELLLPENGEFPRIDDRWAMKKHRHAFFDLMDMSAGTDWATVMPVAGGGFPPYNSLGHLDLQTKRFQKYFPGPTHFTQEPVFVPRGETAEEGDGYLIALVNNYATMASELHVVDTRDFSKPQAVVYLPVRLRAGLHGNWVDAKEMAGIEK
ncbi:carotenoid oxygenase [Aspergillus pseudoustus]|uniref:Carotenoid oxygenase n=1 Tax=Aspergillus pseudoustus TaxID=1810923 RepID=A0ABR4IW95_9EURO